MYKLFFRAYIYIYIYIYTIQAHILLTLEKEHSKTFGDKPPMTGCRKPKPLKDHLVSAKFKCEPSSDNKSAPYCRSRCQIFPFIAETKTF